MIEPEGPEARHSSQQSPVSQTRWQDVRESSRQQLLDGIGGWSGALISAYRLIRRQPVQHALSGLVGVLIAAFIAHRTGQARGFFLIGIITSFLYAVPFAASVLVRRPLIGLAWEFLDPTPTDDEVAWHRRRPLLVAYTWATVVATAVFLLRGIVQLTLYRQNATGWLAVARIAMGYPLFLAAIGFSFLVVTRARRRVTGTTRS